MNQSAHTPGGDAACEKTTVSGREALVNCLISLVETGTPAEQCLAIKGLGTLAEISAVPVLIEATRQEDEDVRADALAVLAKLQDPAAAEALVWSLENDPVLESKIAVIQGLVAAGNRDVLPLLRDLVVDRCEDRVAFEDETSDWDDWLDVQKECVKALGALGDEDGAEKLMEAARDEFGQELWPDVLDALSHMKTTGLLQLIDTARDPSARVRERTAKVLAQTEDARAADVLKVLFTDADPDVRLAAASSLLMRGEPDFGVSLVEESDARLRKLAIEKGEGLRRAKLVDLGFTDENTDVRIAALTALKLRDLAPVEEDIVRLTEQNLRSAGDPLKMHMAALLAACASKEALDLLLDIERLNAAPVIRKAALGALAGKPDPKVLERFSERIGSDSQMVRLAAISGLASLAKATEAAAGEATDVASNAAAVLGLVLSGTLIPEQPKAKDAEKDGKDADNKEAGNNESGPRFGAMASDDEGARRGIKLDREGNIIEPSATEKEPEAIDLAAYRQKQGEPIAAEPAPIEVSDQVQDPTPPLSETDIGAGSTSKVGADVVAFPQSTLGAIMQTEDDIPELSEEKIDLSGKDLKFLELAQQTVSKKRVRPDDAPDIELDLRRMAANVAAANDLPNLLDGLLTCLQSRDKELRLAAAMALTRRFDAGERLSAEQLEALPDLQPEPDPAVRSQLLRLHAQCGGEIGLEILRSGLKDKAPAVRAVAIEGLIAADAEFDAGAYLKAAERPIRLAAVRAVLKGGRAPDELEAVLDASMLESGAVSKAVAYELAISGVDRDLVRQAIVERCVARDTQRLVALDMIPVLEGS